MAGTEAGPTITDIVSSQTSPTPSDSGNEVVITSAVTATNSPTSAVQSVQIVTITRPRSTNSGSGTTTAGTASSTATPLDAGHKPTNNHSWIIGLVVGVVSLDVIIIIICILWRRRRRLKRRKEKRLEKERQRQLAGDVTVNLGVVTTTHEENKQHERPAQPGRRRSSDSEDWEAAPRPPRPDLTRAYIAKPGGVEVANSYMAQQREQGWVSQGLLPMSAKRFGNTAEKPSTTETKRGGAGSGIFGKLGLGRSSKSKSTNDENTRGIVAQELGEVKHDQRLQQQQQPPLYNPTTQAQNLQTEEVSRQETGTVSPLTPEYRIPFIGSSRPTQNNPQQTWI